MNDQFEEKMDFVLDDYSFMIASILSENLEY